MVKGAPLTKKVVVMEALSNKALVDAYIKAKEMKLDDEFINLLEKELERRGIPASQINLEE